MRNKHHMPTTSFPATRSSSRSRILLLLLSLLAFPLLILLFSLSSQTKPPSLSPSLSFPSPETSFVASLDRFLSSNPSPRSPDDTVRIVQDNDVTVLDDRAFKSETERLYGGGDPSYPLGFPVRVYVYEMPRKFTYDLLWLFEKTYRETDNLTSNGSPVHRLIEQHSVDYWLWADLIAPESERLLKSVVRVTKQEEADLFYVPFFTTISFFLLEKQQCKALYRVKL